ncbi:MAG: DUF2948 family protein [Rubricella sp.]
MSDDARFEDGAERPLRLIAADTADVDVISAVLQDAIVSGGDITWQKSRRRFALLVNRLRREDHPDEGGPERVRTLVVFDDVLSVRAAGLDPADKDSVYAILRLEASGEDGVEMRLILAGDGEVALTAEAVNITVDDVSRPYRAPSGRMPDHKLD